MRRLFLSFLVSICSIAIASAQTFPGQYPAFGVFGNPTNAVAPLPVPLSGLLQANASTSINVTPSCAANPGVRGPNFICNDIPGNNLAGQAAGQQIWIGGTLLGTPGANGATGQSIYIDNLNNRSAIWGQNFVCTQQPLSVSTAATGIVHCSEANMVASIAPTTPTSAFSAGSVVHGYESVCNQNTGANPQPCHAGFWVWAAGDYAGNVSSQFQPMSFAFAAARTLYAGHECEHLSGDTGPYFTKGCLWDQSHSNAVIKDSGVHSYFIDLTDNPTFTQFVQGPVAAQANLIFGNQNNFNFYLQCQAGGTVDEECGWFFDGKTSSGSTQFWKFFKDTSNNMRMTNVATGNIVTQWQGNDTVLLGRGANPVTIAPGGQTTFPSNLISGGAAPTGNTGTCNTGVTVAGGAVGGTWTSTAICALAGTIILTVMPTAPTGYSCDMTDRTTNGVTIQQTSTSVTSATFTVRSLPTGSVQTAANDILQYKCLAY